MPADGFKALEAQLGAAPPSSLRDLPGEELQRLADAIREARRRQAAELAAASQQALQHIPKLLRLPIRKMFS